MAGGHGRAGLTAQRPVGQVLEGEKGRATPLSLSTEDWNAGVTTRS